MKLVNTEKAPGAIGPYSQAYEINGVVYTSGQIPVDPENGQVPEGIAAQAHQSCKNVGAIPVSYTHLTSILITTVRISAVWLQQASSVSATISCRCLTGPGLS